MTTTKEASPWINAEAAFAASTQGKKAVESALKHGYAVPCVTTGVPYAAPAKEQPVQKIPTPE